MHYLLKQALNVFYDNPNDMRTALDRTAQLLTEFTLEQQKIIGDALARPGHGFASSRMFTGLGMSDDTITMMPDDIYFDMCVPPMVKAAMPFGGPVFHSCGNWSGKKQGIANIEGIRMVDGAFSLATDPGANPTEGYADAFSSRPTRFSNAMASCSASSFDFFRSFIGANVRFSSMVL